MNTLRSPSNLIRCYTSVNSRCMLHQLSSSRQPAVLSINQLAVFNQQQTRSVTKGRVNTLKEMKKRSTSFDLVPQKRRHRREWLDWNYDCEIYAFNNRLKEKFNEQTLKRAFIAKSHTQQKSVDAEQEESTEENEIEILKQIQIDHNEEFIEAGRKLCDKFIPLYLRFFFRNVPEEGISAIKDYLLSIDILSKMAREIGCSDLILCKEFPVDKKTLADTILSLIGALQTDTDEKHATKFIIDFVLTYLSTLDIMDIWQFEDPHGQLKSILASNNIDEFEYRIMRQSGVNTILASYIIGIYCNKKLLGFGPGSSIGEGKEMAALDCLRRIFNLNIANQVYEFGQRAYDLDYDQFRQPNLSIDNLKLAQLESFR